MNIFRIAGDMIHLIAITILPVRICHSRTCSGISGKTQLLYTLVYISRYSDLFTNFISFYNTTMKVIFIILSCLSVLLIFGIFRSTYNHKQDTFRIWILPSLALVLALMLNHDMSFMEISWTFSIYLEAVVALPQLYMVARTGHPEMVIVHYLLAMWSYRAFYILNWIYRYNVEGFYDLIAIGAGIVQTLIYAKFFYHYGVRAYGSPRDSVNEEKDKDLSEDTPKVKNQSLRVLECWPECFDKLLAPSYEPLTSSVDKETWKPVSMIVDEPIKDGKKECLEKEGKTESSKLENNTICSKEVYLPSSKV